MSSNETRKKILEVKNLDVVFGSGKKTFKAIDGVSFDIYEGETFGLVGESGSGKTTIGRAIIRINEAAGGEILYKGERISGKISPEMDRKVIENIQMIFQDPMASLNERAKVDYIISEGLYNHHKFKNEEERKQIVSQALWQNPSGFSQPLARKLCPTSISQAWEMGFSYWSIRSSYRVMRMTVILHFFI